MKSQKQFPEKERNSPDMIHMRLGTSITLLSLYAQGIVTRCLSCLPLMTIDHTIKNIVFLGQSDLEVGSFYSFDHSYFKAKTGFILLSKELWNLKPIEIAFVIAHEVAHAFNHNNVIRYKGNILEKRIKMEEEANKLAIKWLEKRYSKERLLQLCKHSY
jgi:hypothetical protein